jgi:hypothetical protein
MDYTQKEMRKANEITNQRLNKGSEKFNNHEVRITKLETWRDSK